MTAALVHHDPHLLGGERRRAEGDSQAAVDLRVEERRGDPRARVLFGRVDGGDRAVVNTDKDRAAGGEMPGVENHGRPGVYWVCCRRSVHHTLRVFAMSRRAIPWAALALLTAPLALAAPVPAPKGDDTV